MERRITYRDEFKTPLELVLSIGSDVSHTGICRAHGVDISSDGLGLSTECPLHRFMVVRLGLHITCRATVPVFAEVKWTEPTTDGFRAGVCFLQ